MNEHSSKGSKNEYKYSDVCNLKFVTICGCWGLNFDFGNIFWMLVSDANVKNVGGSDRNYQNRHQNLIVVIKKFRLQIGSWRKIPGKAFLKSESRTSVTFKLYSSQLGIRISKMLFPEFSISPSGSFLQNRCNRIKLRFSSREKHPWLLSIKKDPCGDWQKWFPIPKFSRVSSMRYRWNRMNLNKPLSRDFQWPIGMPDAESGYRSHHFLLKLLIRVHYSDANISKWRRRLRTLISVMIHRSRV